MPHLQDSLDMNQPTLSVAQAIGNPAEKIANEGQRVERLPGVHLTLEMGNILVIKLPPAEQKYECRLLGMDSFNFLIVLARLPQDVVSRLAVNPNLVAQHLAAGAVYGFRSVVMNRITVPAPMLFLAFPDSVERVVLRRNERVSVNIHGSLHGRYGDHEIMLTDMTPSGCQISAAIDLRSPLRSVKPGEELPLSCELGRGQMLMVPVLIRRVDESKGLLSLGCQFVKLDEETSKMVGDFVQSVLKYSRS